ncbi:MAG: acyl-CoA thioester hydrolase YciA [Alphaproteobacteria bacterium]|jgi:acyl-CoA thioesterase YciA|nr:acyl-CoA thioester hydrolase YciA [Alphaproteobacteria bacterium]MBT7942993.1 acyl-CoA thioester hydrolase YciA [Alphaproteobacteria bacterium]
MAENSENGPKGELAIRTLAMPADANPHGDIFGGWLISQMDIAGGVTANARAHGRVATIAVTGFTFHKPVMVGDVVCCYADIQKTGRTSITIGIEAWALRRNESRDRLKVTEGVFTFVAIDEDGKPRPVPPQ